MGRVGQNSLIRRNNRAMACGVALWFAPTGRDKFWDATPWALPTAKMALRFQREIRCRSFSLEIPNRAIGHNGVVESRVEKGCAVGHRVAQVRAGEIGGRTI